MNKLTYTIDEAKRSKACELIDDVRDWKQLCQLFFEPKGREYCQRMEFPSLSLFREIAEEVKPYGIHVDAGQMLFHKSEERLAFVGDTEAIIFAEGANKIFRVIACHGAKVTIQASDYAVVAYNTVGTAEITLINADNTAVMLED